MRGKKTLSEEETKQEVRTIKAKGEPLIRCCCACGVQFDELVNTNTWHHCPVCESEFLCRVKPAIAQD